MSIITEIADIFGIRSTPWVIRVYLMLIIVCAALIVFAASSTPISPDSAAVQSQLLDFAIDSFKIVLGAVIGALSMAASHKWGNSSQIETEENSGG